MTTDVNDLVLIYLDNKPLSYARIEAIEPDIKPEWYQVRLLLLQLPLSIATWILRSAYINGAEFTMGGKQMRLEKVVAPEMPDLREKEDPETKRSETDSHENIADQKPKIISLKDFKKK
jgi:hypothetical protein